MSGDDDSDEGNGSGGDDGHGGGTIVLLSCINVKFTTVSKSLSPALFSMRCGVDEGPKAFHFELSTQQ